MHSAGNIAALNGGRPFVPAAAMPPVDQASALARLSEALRAADVDVRGVPIVDGKIHRVPGLDAKKRGDDAGRYVVHECDNGLLFALYWNMRTGVEGRWSSRNESTWTARDRAEVERRRKETEAQREAEHAEAAARAREIWETAQPAPPVHAYLIAKGIDAHGARVDVRGNLVVPALDEAGDMTSLQFIGPDDKRFLPGGRVRGCYSLIEGDPLQGVYVVEGFATGATIAEATGGTVYVAFNAGNLDPVTALVRRTYRDVTICGDDDQRTPGNPGRKAAEAAARKHGCAAAFPQFESLDGGPTDFNDLAAREGLDAVRASLRRGDAIHATPYEWVDEANLPWRQWLYGGHLIRKFVSVTVAQGAVGKTSKIVADALALATGRSLLGIDVHGGPLRVWIWNLEDPLDELRRRIAATCKHYGITREDVGGRLFVDSGRDMGLCIAKQTQDGPEILEPVVDQLVAELKRRQIDVLFVDPFVSSHKVHENDTGAIDEVAKTWGRVAELADCSIELVHHMRKTGGNAGGVEDSRGAIALINAARSANVLNRMTDKEGAAAGVGEFARYFSSFDGKANLAPMTSKRDWFRFESVLLSNGDNVGVVESWQWPDPFDDVPRDALLKVQRAVDGKDYPASVQAVDWVGHAIGEVLGIDVTEPAGRSKVKGLIKTWIKGRALVIDEGRNGKGRPRPVIRVGEWQDGR